MKKITMFIVALLVTVAAVTVGVVGKANAEPTPTCTSVNDVPHGTPCQYTAAQLIRTDGIFLRSVNGGPFMPFVPEVTLQSNLDNCKRLFNVLYDENRQQFFELQDLRPRVAVAESDLRLAQADLKRAERQIDRQQATIQRLRDRLARR